MDLRFRGITLKTIEIPRAAALEDFPAVREQPGAAAAELDRLEDVGAILRHPQVGHPRDLRACPWLLIVKPDKMRMTRK